MIFTSKPIDHETLVLLETSVEVEGDGLKITRQLDRKEYTKLNKVLEAIGTKWNRKAKLHVPVNGALPEDLLDEVLQVGKVPDANPYDFYRTGEEVAEGLVGTAIEMFLEGNSNHTRKRINFLEPSCGDGALIAAIQAVCARYGYEPWVEAWDIEPAMVKSLSRFDSTHGPGNVSGNLGDFLNQEDLPKTEIVVMNPPFTAPGNPTAYIDHVKHAYDQLPTNGVLAAIVPSTYMTRESSKVKSLRDLMDPLAGFMDLTVEGPSYTDKLGKPCHVSTVAIFKVKV